MKSSTIGLALISVGCLAALAFQPAEAEVAEKVATAAAHVKEIKLWQPLIGKEFAWYEKIALCANVLVALAGLYYAWMLMGQVKNADQGTPRMQDIARAIRDGADAYCIASSAWSAS